MRLILLRAAVAFILQAAMSDPPKAGGNKVESANPHARAQRVNHKADGRARHQDSVQSGVASFYWQSQQLASGGRFRPDAMTAAHRSLPFGTRVRVTHTGNGRSVDVRINDRGPFTAGRIIDLSKAAADVIGMSGQGIARVTLTVLGRCLGGPKCRNIAEMDRRAVPQEPVQQGHLGGVVAVDADVAPIDADKGLVKGDAQTLSEIDDRVTAERPDSADEH